MKTNLKTSMVASTTVESISNSQNIKTLWQNAALIFLTNQTFKMKTRNVFTLFIALFISLTFNQLQAQMTEYQATYATFPNEDYTVKSIVSTPDNGTVVTGIRTRVNPEDYSIEFDGVYAQRTDSTGRVLWLKYYHIDQAEGCYFEPTTIENAYDGGFIIGGFMALCHDFDQATFLMKIDDNGYSHWTKFHHNNNNVFLKEIKQDGTGGYVGIATFYEQGMQPHWGTLVFIADDQGYLANQRLFQLEDSDLEAVAIEKYPEGGSALLIKATTYEENISRVNPLVIKIDDYLNVEWNRFISQELNYVSPIDIAIGHFDDILVTGNVNPFGEDASIYLVSLLPNGNLNWDNTFSWGLCDNFQDFQADVKGLTVDETGNIYIGGNDWLRLHDDGTGNIDYSNDGFVIRTNFGGMGRGVNFYGREFEEMMTCMASRNGKGFVFGGDWSAPTNGDYSFRIWTTVADDNGNSDCDYTTDILKSQTADFSVNVVGIETSNADVNLIESAAEADLQSVVANICYNIVTTQYDEMPMIGNPSPQIQQNDLSKALKTVVSPNPTEGKFNIKMDTNWNEEMPTQVTILDTTGKVILTQEIKDFDTEFDMTNLAKGAYFVKIQSGEELRQHKLIIQ